MTFARTVVTNASTLTPADTIQRLEGKIEGVAGTIVDFAPAVRVVAVARIGAEADLFGGAIGTHRLVVSDGRSFLVRADVSAYTVPAR